MAREAVSFGTPEFLVRDVRGEYRRYPNGGTVSPRIRCSSGQDDLDADRFGDVDPLPDGVRATVDE